MGSGSKVLVAYHGGCYDGFCAAWLFSKAFPDAEYFPAQYSGEVPDVSGKSVFVVDFSYPRETMLDMLTRCNSLVVLDHHKTAEQAITTIKHPNYTGVFDLDKSGGRLAWEYLFSRKLLSERWLDQFYLCYNLQESPWLVDYTEDRDLWKFQLANSREINAALRSYPQEFAEWDRLHTLAWNVHGKLELATEGRAILRNEAKIVDSHVKHARPITLDGYEILCVNATTLISEIAGKLAEGRPFGATYFDRQDGMRVWSLRSRTGSVDVSEIAKRRGGGGHPQAAGFEVPLA